MNILVLSDIHGALKPLHDILAYAGLKSFDTVLFVGDFLNPGPRNPITPSYNPTQVADQINAITLPKLAVRGNCDSEVDQMLIHLPLMNDYLYLKTPRKNILVTHGHLHPEQLPEAFDIQISGHTHIPLIAREKDRLFLNPGSIALPKGGFPPSFGELTDTDFTIRNAESFQVLMQVNFDGE